MPWETVIGFEIHTELLTRSKVWCGCSTAFGRPPNTQVCPICLGMPGTLPVLNKAALELSMRAALALNCTIAPLTQFERKNYYYPDLPKNYQISQLRRNLATGGWLELPANGHPAHRIRINNIHLEEDAGKNIHPDAPGADYSLVDLNRAGTPLLEIVTEPDLRGAADAQAFMLAIKSLLEYSGVSDCNMHEGRLRFEANISVRPAGSEKLGTKVEVKNLNSIKAVLKCIELETERQIDLLENGETVRQETRLWDEAAGETRAMRGKEEANDYRYFPDPDLVEIEIGPEWIERVRAELPELPHARRRRFAESFGLSDYDAGVLTAQKAVADYFETALAAHNNPKGVCNWITTETLRWLNEDPEREIADYPVPAPHLAELVRLIDENVISGKIAKQVYPEMVSSGHAPSEIVKSRGLQQITDTTSIEPIIHRVVEANQEAGMSYNAGKERALGSLVGKVMKETSGRANPKIANEGILKIVKIFPQVVGEISRLEEQLRIEAAATPIDSQMVDRMIEETPPVLRNCGCFLDKMKNCWRYEFGVPYRLDNGNLLWGRNVWPHVSYLTRALHTMISRLPTDQRIAHLERLAKPNHHDVALSEFLPILNLDSSIPVQNEVCAVGVEGKKCDWQIEAPNGRRVYLEVKRRVRDLVEHVDHDIDDESEAGTRVSPPTHDPSLLFRSVEKKFSPQNPDVNLQGAWVVTDVRQRRSPTEQAFRQMDPDKVHFVIISNWNGEATGLAHRNEDLEFLKALLGYTEKEDMLFDTADEGE